MKIVAISDTHGHKVYNLPDADVLVHAGDWSGAGHEYETITFIGWLKDLKAQYKDIVVVPGNHERWPYNSPLLCKAMFDEAGVHYLIDQEVTIQGKRFYGMPWTHIFNQWAFMATREQRKTRCDVIPDGIDVLVTHGPPHGILDAIENFDGQTQEWGTIYLGCSELLLAIERVKPKLHIFGHIHEGSGEEHYGGIHLVNAAIMDKHYDPVNSYKIIELA